MKQLSALILAISALPIAVHPSEKTPYPDGTIHFIVGFPPGSQPDIVARLVSQRLTEAVQRPIVIENVTGAAGNIAADRIAKARPDGHTVGLLSQTQIVISPLLQKLAYDPRKHFAPISQLTVSPNVLVVNNAVPAKNVAELVALGKAQPGFLTFASSGSGSGTHMAAEVFKSTTALDIRHVPYKGVVAAIPDLVSGRVTMMFSPIPVVLPLVREGKLRAIAVTSSRRSSVVPELPTVAESGYPGFEATNWYGLVAPVGTPAAIVRTLHAETVRALALPELHAKLMELGLDVIGNSPDEFAAAIEAEVPKWAKAIKDEGIKAD